MKVAGTASSGRWITGSVSRTAATATLVFLLFAVGVLSATCASAPPPLPPLPGLAEGPTPSYREQVQPILENRCVVCHGCYDAPCQLQLSSHAGLERGASKQAVYHSSRLTEADPTRLFIDARSTAEWRERDFFSVLESSNTAAPDGLLLRMLALGRSQTFAAAEKLPETVPLDISRGLSCPTSDQFDSYRRDQPFGGMPYGTAPLTDEEVGVLARWVAQGAPAPPAPAGPSASVRARSQRWEAFLNGESLKERITARYLYEHWFLAHLTFTDLPVGPFFRIVRSRTPPGTSLDEIASRRPFDDPGTERFWYRLQPIETTIVHKTHIVYPLNDAKLGHLKELFLEADWKPTRFPGYDIAEASNPFVSFDQIPARSRYQFLLDDARYFLMTFIRGAVCRGQVAVDVIEDRFFVAFFDPDHDVSVIDPGYLEETKELLSLPAEHVGDLAPDGFWHHYDRLQRQYLEIRERYYDEIDPKRIGPSLDFIWDGDGDNRNALLTVFRHFDNATVVWGFLGAVPETAWVLDYPTLERIYYDLVANFDVFGNLKHQISTRQYMDHLRMQSENLFLAFLPAERREEIRDSWYLGADRNYSFRSDAIHSTGHGTQISFTSADEKAELLERLLERSVRVSGPPDLLNRCAAPPCDRRGAAAVERRAERALQPLTGVRGPWVALLPDLALLRVRSGEAGETDAVYALIHDKAHTNVASMFHEDERRLPEEDTLTVARGYLGSYPNFLYEVEVAQIELFAKTLSEVGDAADFEALVERWGVRRTSPHFWQNFDWMRDDYRRRSPIEAGLLDLGRYNNL